MQTRARSDAKYWAQIQAAHRLLVESTAQELELSEVMQSNQRVFDSVFEDLQAQETMRLSAVEMLQVLTSFVSEMDRDMPCPAAVRTPPPTTATQEALCAASPSTPKRSGEASPDCLGTPSATPKRRRVTRFQTELTPPPVVRRRRSEAPMQQQPDARTPEKC